MATVKKAAKKATAKKAVSKKAPAKKAVVRKATAKKAVAKKATVKKAVVTKAATKKAVVKKSAVKKSVVKKSTSTRALTTKKAAPKKVVARTATTSRSVVAPTRSRYISDAPVRTSAPSQSGAGRSAAPVEAKRISNLYSEGTSTTEKSGKPLAFLAVLILVLVGFIAISNTSKKAGTTDVAQPVASESAAPATSESAAPAASESAAPAASESADQSTTSGSTSFNLRYSYNSIGITVSFSEVAQFGSASSIVLKASENGAAPVVLGKFAGNALSARIAKVDTVGKTTFTAVVTLKDGSSVTSAPLSIRGAFSAE